MRIILDFKRLTNSRFDLYFYLQLYLCNENRPATADNTCDSVDGIVWAGRRVRASKRKRRARSVICCCLTCWVGWGGVGGVRWLPETAVPAGPPDAPLLCFRYRTPVNCLGLACSLSVPTDLRSFVFYCRRFYGKYVLPIKVDQTSGSFNVNISKLLII